MPYICPICQQSLKQHLPSQGYYCENKHHFDLAKEGYLNLLPVQHKKSKQPGDSREMMRARRHFLEQGFYQPMAKAVAEMIDTQHQEGTVLNLLDMGCGEGYYSRQIKAFCQRSESINLHGIDIAKNAIFAAAKKQQDAKFIVASNKQMPYSEQFFDLILRVYAPSNEAEVSRILKTKGLLLTVTPGPRHLWQLKQFIYKTVNEHAIEIEPPANFTEINRQRVQYTIKPNQQQRMALLQMTPFAWRAKPQMQQAIQRATGLEIETDFILTLVQK